MSTYPVQVPSSGAGIPSGPGGVSVTDMLSPIIHGATLYGSYLATNNFNTLGVENTAIIAGLGAASSIGAKMIAPHIAARIPMEDGNLLDVVQRQGLEPVIAGVLYANSLQFVSIANPARQESRFVSTARAMASEYIANVAAPVIGNAMNKV